MLSALRVQKWPKGVFDALCSLLAASVALKIDHVLSYSHDRFQSWLHCWSLAMTGFIACSLLKNAIGSRLAIAMLQYKSAHRPGKLFPSFRAHLSSQAQAF